MRKLQTGSMVLIFVVVFAGCGSDSERRNSIPPTTQRATSRGAPDALISSVGRVLTTDRTPIPGATVDPIPLDGQSWAEFDSLRTTDETGGYQLPLPAGRWRLDVAADGFTPAHVQLTVPTRGRVTTDVALERA